MKAPSSSIRNPTTEVTPSIADSVDETDELQNDVAADAIADAAAAAAADEIAEAAEVVAKESGAASLLKGGAARITVEENVEDDTKDGVETTRTNVKVEMPTGYSEGAPKDPEAAIEAAKAIVTGVKDLKSEENLANGIVAAGKKRKVDDLETEEPEEEIVEELVNGDAESPAKGNESSPSGKKKTTKKQQQETTSPSLTSVKKGEKVEFGARANEPPAKRARIMVPAEDFRRQKMQKRALVGLSATLAVGLVLTFFFDDLVQTELCSDPFPMKGCIPPFPVLYRIYNPPKFHVP